MKRDFLAIPDFTREELYELLALARRMKSGKYKERPLEGKQNRRLLILLTSLSPKWKP